MMDDMCFYIKNDYASMELVAAEGILGTSNVEVNIGECSTS